MWENRLYLHSRQVVLELHSFHVPQVPHFQKEKKRSQKLIKLFLPQLQWNILFISYYIYYYLFNRGIHKMLGK